MLIIKPKSTKTNNLKTIGSVRYVIKGEVPENLSEKKFKASDYEFGFELASPLSLESMGEGIVVNGKCYATSTDCNSENYNETISGDDFFTTGMLTVPKEAQENYEVILNENSHAMAYQDVLNQIFKAVKKPFVLVANVHFKSMHATAISKAPIYNENIFEKKQNYYQNPILNLKNIHGFIMGCAADFSQINDEKLHKDLQKALYHNPMDKTASLNAHTHGVTLTKAVESDKQITPDIVDKTLHIFNDQTIVQSMKGKVYNIDKLTSIA